MLLARREHSRRELQAKLKAKGVEPELINPVIDRLVTEGLQSDRRFADNYLHSRIQKGYGPSRLENELYERGIDAELVQSCLGALAVDWMDVLQSVRQKKFGPARPSGFSEQARESRFLHYRGFTADQIRNLYKNYKTDDQ